MHPAPSSPHAATRGGGSDACLAPRMRVGRTQVLGYMRGQMVEVTPPEGVQPSGLHIVCILNPLTRPAQRISQASARE